VIHVHPASSLANYKLKRAHFIFVISDLKSIFTKNVINLL
jgi:hypothetical protein